MSHLIVAIFAALGALVVLLASRPDPHHRSGRRDRSRRRAPVCGLAPAAAVCPAIHDGHEVHADHRVRRPPVPGLPVRVAVALAVGVGRDGADRRRAHRWDRRAAELDVRADRDHGAVRAHVPLLGGHPVDDRVEPPVPPVLVPRDLPPDGDGRRRARAWRGLGRASRCPRVGDAYSSPDHRPRRGCGSDRRALRRCADLDRRRQVVHPVLDAVELPRLPGHDRRGLDAGQAVDRVPRVRLRVRRPSVRTCAVGGQHAAERVRITSGTDAAPVLDPRPHLVDGGRVLRGVGNHPVPLHGNRRARCARELVRRGARDHVPQPGGLRAGRSLVAGARRAVPRRPLRAGEAEGGCRPPA